MTRHERLQGLRQRFYGGARWDGTASFYGWLRHHTTPECIVLNVGAGPASNNRTRCLRGEVKEVVGVDLDDAVLKNNELDKAVVINGARLPFDTDHFDLVWADFVMEHVEDPESLVREIRRVLKPGCPFFFRTPNGYHYVALAARGTPHWFHTLVANRVRGLPQDSHEPYETFYRFNTKKSITAVSRDVGFSSTEIRLVETEPSYLMFDPMGFFLGLAYERCVNRFASLDVLRSNIFGCLVK